MIPQRSYADVSFLLVHACTLMLEAKQPQARKSRERHYLPQICIWHLLHGMHSKEKKAPYSLKRLSPTRLPTVSLQWASESKNQATNLLLTRLQKKSSTTLVLRLKWFKLVEQQNQNICKPHIFVVMLLDSRSIEVN